MKYLVALVFMLAACDMNAVGPGAPFVVPTVYSQWFSETESCSGLSGDLSRVRFSTRDDMGFMNGKPIYGYWRDDNQIIFRSDMVLDKKVVQHELMHFLLQGGDDHPAYYFVNGPCGNLMGASG